MPLTKQSPSVRRRKAQMRGVRRGVDFVTVQNKNKQLQKPKQILRYAQDDKRFA